MAEFCLDCMNLMNETDDPPEKYIISKELYLCEGCGKLKKIVIDERREYYFYLIKKIMFPVRIIFFPVELVVRLIYALYRFSKR